MLSAKGEIFDKVLGLELGADDYILKPFDSKELVARVKAVLRRYQPVKTESVVELKYVEYPDLVVNLSNYSVMYNGKPIDMPPKELELLYFLASSPNQVFTRAVSYTHLSPHHRPVWPFGIEKEKLFRFHNRDPTRILFR